MINWFLIVADGVKRGDYPTMYYQYSLIVSDGVKREDYPTMHYQHSLIVSDGVKRGDYPMMYYQYLFSGRPKGLVKKEVYQKLDTPLF